ncbi:MAG: Nif3-like dinuclear metal center hexameric protein [Actinobacteria bacterium]|nr:Nif3-like dinuclear metal center hexameric protein [Actinomycetota bacterium]
MVLLRDLMDALGERFPWGLAVEDDNCGLQVGSLNSDALRALCAVDVTGTALERAEASGCDLLVTHHPLIDDPVLSIDTGEPRGSLIERVIENGMNVIACHTSADSSPGGLADIFAEHLGLVGVEPIQPASWVPFVKAVVFVPPEALEDVSEAMADAGAGVIGKYRHCGFRTSGTGTFIPGEDAAPYSGEVGRLNLAEEVRLEMIVPSFLLKRAVKAMLGRHPYEQVAYDIYKTDNPVPWGLGRIGTLKEERTLGDIQAELAKWCASPDPRLVGDPSRKVSSVAVVPGAANSFVEPSRRLGAELLVAGEVNYHMWLEADEAGLALVCLGHRESERVFVPMMVESLRAASDQHGWNLEIESYDDREVSWR